MKFFLSKIALDFRGQKYEGALNLLFYLLLLWEYKKCNEF